MRYLIIIFLAVFMPSLASAEVYLIVNKATNEILSISPKDDAILPDNTYDKVILQADFRTVLSQLDEDIQYYKYQNGRIVKNIQKLDEVQHQENIRMEKNTELIKVSNRSLELACLDLVGSGTTFKHISCDDFK